MKKQACGLLFRYSLLHFCVDWACILLVTGPVRQGIMDHALWLWCVLLYNAAAFALQLPLGALLDLLGRERQAAGLGCLLVALGWLIQPAGLWRCLVAGVGNALFHLGGGSQVLCHSDRRAGPSGIFVSTGAVGVWLGLWCARHGVTSPVLPVAVMALAGATALLFPDPDVPAPAASAAPLRPEGKLILGGLFLFGTVCIRSWVGGLMSYPWQVGIWSLAGVLCVALGKALGGLIGDRFGFLQCAAVTLTAAALLFPFAPAVPAAGLLAAFLFNTSMPLTLTALANALGPAHRAFAFGLTTFAIFWGTLPGLFTSAGVGNGAALSALSLGSAALICLGLFWTKGREGRPC